MVPKVRTGAIVRKLKKAAPYILSGLSAVGVVATAIFSAKATVKALSVVNDKKLTEKEEIVAATWKLYIPTALTAIATAACIISNTVFTKQQMASLASAYALLHQNYKKYRDKVKDIYGVEGDRKVMAATVAENRPIIDVEVSKSPSVLSPGFLSNTCLDWGTDEEEVKHLFYDGFTGKIFTSTISKVLQAEIALNRDLNIGGFVSLNLFYDYLGLDPITGGDELGWCICDGYTFLDFNHFKSKLEDVVPEGCEPLEALVIEYDWIPMTESQIDEL